MLYSKPLGPFFGGQISSWLPGIEVISAKWAGLNPRAGKADGAQHMAVVAGKDLPRVTHELKAHRAVQVLCI